MNKNVEEANMQSVPMHAQEMHNRKQMNKNIDPEEIIVDDDADMPQPETREYEQLIRLTDKFMVLFNEAIKLSSQTLYVLQRLRRIQ